MGEGVGIRGGNFRTTVGMYDQFGGERLCDTPISERGFVGLRVGGPSGHGGKDNPRREEKAVRPSTMNAHT